MNEQMLPIGTIIKLKDNNNYFMIAGYDPKGTPTLGYIYDYSGFPYPMGHTGTLEIIQFDKEQIEDIIAYGYQNKEQMEFMKHYCNERVPIKGERG
jgi:hypothetical protein